MASQKFPILLNLFAALLGALGQYFYKIGAQRSNFLAIGAGVLLFIGVMACFVFAYKLGGRISVVYPFYATTFVWGALIGVFWEGEPWASAHFVGLGLIFAGLTVIALQLRS